MAEMTIRRSLIYERLAAFCFWNCPDVYARFHLPPIIARQKNS